MNTNEAGKLIVDDHIVWRGEKGATHSGKIVALQINGVIIEWDCVPTGMKFTYIEFNNCEHLEHDNGENTTECEFCGRRFIPDSDSVRFCSHECGVNDIWEYEQ